MRLLALTGALLLIGCSTAPIADTLDAMSPGRIQRGQGYGGVNGHAVPPPQATTPTIVPAAPAAATTAAKRETAPAKPPIVTIPELKPL